MARSLRALVPGMILTLALIGCVSCTSPPGATAPSVRHANTAPFVPHESASATLRMLIPLGNCVLGIADKPGNGVINWVGESGCTRLVPSPRSGFAVSDAVPMDDGSIIGVGESLIRRDPDGSVHRLAALPPQFQQDVQSPRTPFALARSGQHLIVMGRQAAHEEQRKEDIKWLPTAWESTDDGVTINEIPLPLPPVRDYLHLDEALGLGPSTRPMAIATDGETVLATDGVEYGDRLAFRIWRSVDGGRTWEVHPAPLYLAPPRDLVAMLKAGGRWLLIFQNNQQGSPGEPDRLVLSSLDGAEWTVEKGLDLGSGLVVAATRDREHNLVLIGWDYEPCSPGSIRCLPFVREVVWTGSIGHIVRRDLKRWAKQQPTAAVATLADGRVLVTDNGGTLWIRE